MFGYEKKKIILAERNLNKTVGLENCDKDQMLAFFLSFPKWTSVPRIPTLLRQDKQAFWKKRKGAIALAKQYCYSSKTKTALTWKCFELLSWNLGCSSEP